MASIGQQTALSKLPAQAQVGDLSYQEISVLQQHIGRLEVHVHDLPRTSMATQ